MADFKNLKEELDATEPVFFCKHCFSLKVMNLDPVGPDLDYCDECGSTDIAVAPNIKEYLKLKELKK